MKNYERALGALYYLGGYFSTFFALPTNAEDCYQQMKTRRVTLRLSISAAIFFVLLAGMMAYLVWWKKDSGLTKEDFGGLAFIEGLLALLSFIFFMAFKFRLSDNLRQNQDLANSWSRVRRELLSPEFFDSLLVLDVDSRTPYVRTIEVWLLKYVAQPLAHQIATREKEGHPIHPDLDMRKARVDDLAKMLRLQPPEWRTLIKNRKHSNPVSKKG